MLTFKHLETNLHSDTDILVELDLAFTFDHALHAGRVQEDDNILFGKANHTSRSNRSVRDRDGAAPALTVVVANKDTLTALNRDTQATFRSLEEQDARAALVEEWGNGNRVVEGMISRLEMSVHDI